MSHRITIDRRTFVAAAALLPAVVQAQRMATEGRDYRLITPAQRVMGDKILVLEFFQYSCPACAAFTPHVEKWHKTLRPDVEFRRISINWDDSTVNHSKTYYALEYLNRLDLHEKFFAAMDYRGRRLMLEPRQAADFMANNGIDRAKWNDAFGHKDVAARVKRAGETWRAYGINGTPTMAVDGRFTTSPEMVNSREGTLTVLDFLIARARTERVKK